MVLSNVVDMGVFILSCLLNFYFDSKKVYHIRSINAIIIFVLIIAIVACQRINEVCFESSILGSCIQPRQRRLFEVEYSFSKYPNGATR